MTPALPENAACAVHEATPASFLCTRCGTFGCDACAFSRAKDHEVCRACAAQGLGEPIPWERRAELGRIRAFWETTKLATMSPRAFFKTPTTEPGAMPAIMYGIAAYTVGQLIYVLSILLLLFVASLIAAAVGAGTDNTPLGGVGLVMAGYSVCWAFLAVPLTLVQSPVSAVLGIVAGGGLSHLTLRIMKCAKVPFEETLRVVSYANAPHYLYFIPCVGPFVSWFWTLWCEIVGLREAHRIGTDRAVVAVVGYRLLLILLLVLGYAALIGALYLFERSSRGGPS